MPFKCRCQLVTSAGPLLRYLSQIPFFDRARTREDSPSQEPRLVTRLGTAPRARRLPRLNLAVHIGYFTYIL